MDPAVTVLLLWVGFIATHLGLASVRVEPGLRARLGDGPFLGLYSLVALAFFVPLVWVYFDNRHAGEWLWFVGVGPALRVVLYLLMTLALLVIVAGQMNPSPAALGSSGVEIRGVYRITRHPVVIGFGLMMALHLIPNASTSDLAFFGGFTIFTVLGAWHQDARKLAAGNEEFRAFYEATTFLPFTRLSAWLGLTEIPPLCWAIAIAGTAGLRWLHPNGLWPH